MASLSPRTDRLDRERLIFLAGQQSVASGDISPARHAGHWGWPAAFAAMTAVAATLLVALLVRGQPQVEVRVVKVPAEPAGNGEVAPGPDTPAPRTDGPRLAPLPDSPGPFPRPVAGSGFFALVGLDWAQLDDRERPGSEKSYPRLLDQVLREGIDSWPAPSPVADLAPASAPVPYRELLQRVLGTPGSDGSVPDWPLIQTLFYPGANS